MLKVYENADFEPGVDLVPTASDQILIRGLSMMAFIGIFNHEYETKQAIEIDLIIDIATPTDATTYNKSNILRYDHIVADIEALLADSHFELVETLAETIAQAVFQYESAGHICVTVTKLDAIKQAKDVGVRLRRKRAV